MVYACPIAWSNVSHGRVGRLKLVTWLLSLLWSRQAQGVADGAKDALHASRAAMA